MEKLITKHGVKKIRRNRYQAPSWIFGAFIYEVPLLVRSVVEVLVLHVADEESAIIVFG